MLVSELSKNPLEWEHETLTLRRTVRFEKGESLDFRLLLSSALHDPSLEIETFRFPTFPLRLICLKRVSLSLSKN